MLDGGPTEIDDLVYGAPAMRADVLKTEVKAVALESRRRAVLARFGEEGVARVAETLPDEPRRLWSGAAFTSSWLPIAPQLEVDRAILRVLCGDDLERLVTIVTEAAESELHLLYRFLLKLGSPGFLLKRIGVAFETKVRPGSMRFVEGGERFGMSEIHDVVLPPYVCARTAPAWAARALELTGARDVETVHTAFRHRGDPCCRYETRWR